MMQQKTVRLPIKLIEELEAIAHGTEYTPTEVMRIAIERGVREMGFMRDLNLNCLDNVSKNLPPLFKQYLFEHMAMLTILEDLLKEKMPSHERFTKLNGFNERVVKKLQNDYFK